MSDLEYFKYLGGGFFRDSRVPVKTKAPIIHAPEVMAQLLEARKLLADVLNSCVHPDQAIRAVFVDVRPIRKFLKNGN